MKKQRHGWLNVCKPANIGSGEFSRIIKKILRAKKVGHAGTLDPFAEGVLPIAIGEATKVINYVQNREKTYEFDLAFGKKSDTGDRDGKFIQSTEVLPTKEAIDAMIPEFIGEIEQVPPVYSALRINGKRAYEIARSGEDLTLQARKVKIYDLKLLSFDFSGKVAKFIVKCGKGTYIRSLGSDLAERLGSLGYISALTRLQVGFFSIKETISLEKMKELVHNGELEESLLSISDVLDDILAINFSEDGAQAILHGNPVALPKDLFADTNADDCVLAKFGEEPLALGRIDNAYFKPIRVFNLNVIINHK